MADNDFKLTVVDLAKINEALRKALETTYLPALIERTPATTEQGARTGETANAWTLTNPEQLKFDFENERGFTAMAFEFGWKGGIIKAKGGKWLRFPEPPYKRRSPYVHIPGNQAFKKDGFIFAKMVRHPGFKAHHYLEQIEQDETLWNAFAAAFARFLGV